MNIRLLIFQVINVIGISNLICAIVVQDVVSPPTIEFAFMFSGILIVASSAMIILFSVLFIQRLDKETERYSTNLSPIFKYLMINPAISAVLVLCLLGLVHYYDLLKVAGLFFLVMLYPLIVFMKSVFVVSRNKEVRFYNYSGEYRIIQGSQIRSIKKVQLGLAYKITFTNDNGKEEKKYFFPKGSFFVFNEPKAVVSLKSMMGN